MRWLIVLLISILVVGDVFSLDMSLAPGLSAKNALLYIIVLALGFRAIVSGENKFELPLLHACCAVLVCYSILTWLAAALVIEYPGYRIWRSAISLKANLVDPTLVFFAVFYGARTLTDVRALTRALALALTFANLMTLADVAGFLHLGIQVGNNRIEEGRVFGVFGHANETAALIVCLLPAMLAVAVDSKRLVRMLMFAGALVSLAVLIMTVSRGAFVGLLVGGAAGAYACRRIIPVGRMALWLVAAVMFVGLAVLVASLASPQTGELVMSRILGQSTSIDMGEASSGRTTLWAAVIARMMSEPITLLTGYGWDTYQTFPFRYVPHNFYLNLWFNLGLPGVLSFLTILLSSARTAAKAAERVVQPMRMYLCAFTIGMLSLVVTIFFTDLFIPWLYIWVYVGASMRAAVIANSAEEAERAALPATPLTTGGSQRWRGPVVAGRWPATSRR